MKSLATMLGCLVVAVLGGIGFIYSGMYDVSATTPDHPMVVWIVHTTSEHSVAARLSDVHPPAGLEKPELIQAGAALYAANCAICHGGPGITRSAISKGLNPAPPNLFRATRKPRADENYQFVKFGVKMTAMPGFGASYSDDQIWSIVAFLNVLPGMTPADFAAKTGLAATLPAG